MRLTISERTYVIITFVYFVLSVLGIGAFATLAIVSLAAHELNGWGWLFLLPCVSGLPVAYISGSELWRYIESSLLWDDGDEP